MTETATARPNTVTVTDVGPSRKKISIEIPAETVAEKLKGSLDLLALEAAIPGFRKGHAPRGLVEKRFGSAVRGETKSQLVAAAYQEAVKEHGLKVVGEPTSEMLASAELKDGQPFAFDLEVEVAPEFSLPKLDGIEILKPILTVEDSQVQDEIKKLCINDGELQEHQSPEPGDYLTGHGVMTGPDGKEFYNINGCVVQLPTPDKAPKGMILGVLVDDFSTQFGAPTPGQTVTIKTTGPENHEVEAIRNTPLTITFKVDRIDRIIPAPLQKVLAAFGMSDESQLRDAIKGRLQQRAAVQQQVAMRSQVAAYLVRNTEMALPERLTAHQAARTLENRRMELMYRGVSAQEIEEHMAELRAGSSALAVRDLKLFFILAKAAEDLSVRVDESEINSRIAQMAFERGERPEKLRQEIIQHNRVGAIYTQVRDHKTMDLILSRAVITEKPAEEYNTIMKERDKAAKA